MMDTIEHEAVLYTYPGNHRAYKGMIAAKYSGVKLHLSENFQLGKTNRTEEYERYFQMGQVPALRYRDGTCVTEPNAIAWSLANEQIRGRNIAENVKIMQWISYADNEILPSGSILVFPCLGIMPYNKSKAEKAEKDINTVLSYLDSYLLEHTYLVGERVTLADISVACILLSLYEHVLEPKLRNPYVNTNRWFTTIINQPEVKEVMGEIKLCENNVKFDKNIYAEMQERIKQNQPTKGMEKPQKTKKPKEQKKVEKEEVAVKPPKQKDPLGELPAGNFSMDSWKKFYSNNDEDESVIYFWENFDKEHYSIWFGEYLYPEELQKTFMTSNLISGMYQRLDKMRDNSFGSMCVFGEDNDNVIRGIFIWRGQELAFPLCPDWTIDYESYSWRKLDVNSDETKTIVLQYLTWIFDKDIKKPFVQGKIFK